MDVLRISFSTSQALPLLLPPSSPADESITFPQISCFYITISKPLSDKATPRGPPRRWPRRWPPSAALSRRTMTRRSTPLSPRKSWTATTFWYVVLFRRKGKLNQVLFCRERSEASGSRLPSLPASSSLACLTCSGLALKAPQQRKVPQCPDTLALMCIVRSNQP